MACHGSLRSVPNEFQFTHLTNVDRSHYVPSGREAGRYSNDRPVSLPGRRILAKRAGSREESLHPSVPRFYEPSPALHELQLLELLSRRPDVTQKAAARELHLSASRVHQYLHELAARGILRMDPHGHRDMRYHLTAAGQSRLHELETQHMAEAGHFVETTTRMASRLVGRAARDGIARLGVLAGPALGGVLAGLAEENELTLVHLAQATDGAALVALLAERHVEGLIVLEEIDDTDMSCLVTHCAEHDIRVYAIGTLNRSGGEKPRRNPEVAGSRH